jgi:hemerythrin-like domain-containing protein
LKKIDVTKEVDPLFVDIIVDFLQMYADRTHHGKEEDILFRDLQKKNLSNDDRRVMNELIEDHIFSRETTKKLIDANSRYKNGDQSSLTDIADHLHALVDLYPRHIEKEDNAFFPASREYFSEHEDQVMLDEFWEFDRKMIHEKYKSVVEALEQD